MTKFLMASLVVAAAFLGGCSEDKCESAGNRLADKMKACGVGVDTSGSDDGNSEKVECTDAAADVAEKLADCYDKLKCEGGKMSAEDTEAATKCITGG